MRTAVLGVLLLAGGCGALIEGLAGGFLDGFEVYSPPPEATVSGARLAFVTSSESANVVCFILDSSGTDVVAQFGAGTKPVAIASGTSGALFISTRDGVRRLNSEWIDLGEIAAEAGVVAFGPLGVDEGRLVVAGETAAGSVIVVYDEARGTFVDLSDPAPFTTITSVTVNGDQAFVVENGGTIAAYDLSTSPPERTLLVADVAGQAAGVVVGHTGNLFVAHATESVLEEFDIATGESLGVLWRDSPSVGATALAFDEIEDRYLLLTDDDMLREIRANGSVAASRGSELVEGVNGVTVAYR